MTDVKFNKTFPHYTTYNINQLKIGQWFQFNELICIKIEEVYDKDSEQLYANAVEPNGQLRLFPISFDLRLIDRVEINY